MGLCSVFGCCVVALVSVTAQQVSLTAQQVNVTAQQVNVTAQQVNVTAQQVKLYDAYYGKPLTERRTDFLSKVVNGTLLCTVPVRPCHKDEGRRVDGTCTNPKHPSRGATLTPFPRLLPAHYGIGNTLRPASDGSPLPSTRHIRTTVIADGKIRDKYLTTLVSKIFAMAVIDSIDFFYILRYAIVSDCCINNQVPNRADPMCIPIPVQDDDPILRRTNIRCMNLTRFETYQDYGCLPITMPLERYNRVPPLLELSPIYGNTEARSKMIRAGFEGLLAFRMEEDREVPAGQSPYCVKNRPENMEVSCYDFGDNYDGVLTSGTNMVSLWFFREHNRLARNLAKINPCWDDQMLFDTARKIAIAEWQKIFFYELIPEIIGYKNALHSGIIFETKGYVNDFDPKSEPGVYYEYMLATRMFHNLLNGVSDLYRNKKYVGSRTEVDDTFRSGILAVNNTEADLTYGCLVQETDAVDCVMDPDLSNRIAGELQAASDVAAIDIMRGRDAGLPSYNEYRKFCGMKPAETFEDFHDTIDKQRVDHLSHLYADVDDVELVVAVYLERTLPGTYVGPTLYCIMAHNLRLWRHSDKFFFEHGGFHAALTPQQLNEVRTTSLARLLCDNGVGVKHIQVHPLLVETPWNEVVPCEKIPGIDLKYWKDHECIQKKK